MNIEMTIFISGWSYTTLTFEITSEALISVFKEDPQRFLSLKKKKLDELCNTYQWSYAIVKVDGEIIGGIKARRAPAVTSVAA